METIVRPKSTASIRIDTDLLNKLKSNAKKDHRSLSNYLETILFEIADKGVNMETLSAVKDAREGNTTPVNMSSYESFVHSILCENEED